MADRHPVPTLGAAAPTGAVRAAPLGVGDPLGVVCPETGR